MEQEERVIPIELITELLKLNAQRPITADTLYSDEEDVRQEAEESAQKMRTYLESYGLSEAECDEYLYKTQRYNELSEMNESVKDELGTMGFSVFGGIIIIAVSAIVTYLLYRFNMYMYNEKHTIWFFAIFINIIAAAIGVISFLYLIVGSIGNGLFNVGRQFFDKHKKPNQDYMEYATYLVENHNYTKEAIKLYFSDFDMEYGEYMAFVDNIKFPETD